jgi:hypothetical protein
MVPTLPQGPHGSLYASTTVPVNNQSLRSAQSCSRERETRNEVSRSSRRTFQAWSCQALNQRRLGVYS